MLNIPHFNPVLYEKGDIIIVTLYGEIETRQLADQMDW